MNLTKYSSFAFVIICISVLSMTRALPEYTGSSLLGTINNTYDGFNATVTDTRAQIKYSSELLQDANSIEDIQQAVIGALNSGRLTNDQETCLSIVNDSINNIYGNSNKKRQFHSSDGSLNGKLYKSLLLDLQQSFAMHTNTNGSPCLQSSGGNTFNNFECAFCIEFAAEILAAIRNLRQ